MEHFKELSETRIFSMATEFECQAMMFCFKTRFKIFEKNQYIINQDEPMDDLVLILKGSANVENMDDSGDVSLVMQLKKGDIYGLESAFAGEDINKDSIKANEKTMVLFMNKHRVITPCENKCKRHEIVTKQLMKIFAEKNMQLIDKLTHVCKKTIREKLLSYLKSIAKLSESKYFEIPFNKTELANYLSVDRSAMSSELSRMRDEGIIDYDKRQFRILKDK